MYVIYDLSIQAIQENYINEWVTEKQYLKDVWMLNKVIEIQVGKGKEKSTKILRNK